MSLERRIAALEKVHRPRRTRPTNVEDMTDEQLNEVIAASMGLTPMQVANWSDEELQQCIEGTCPS
jgi:hypothetical protein